MNDAYGRDSNEFLFFFFLKERFHCWNEKYKRRGRESPRLKELQEEGFPIGRKENKLVRCKLLGQFTPGDCYINNNLINKITKVIRFVAENTVVSLKSNTPKESMGKVLPKDAFSSIKGMSTTNRRKNDGDILWKGQRPVESMKDGSRR